MQDALNAVRPRPVLSAFLSAFGYGQAPSSGLCWHLSMDRSPSRPRGKNSIVHARTASVPACLPENGRAVACRWAGFSSNGFTKRAVRRIGGLCDDRNVVFFVRKIHGGIFGRRSYI